MTLKLEVGKKYRTKSGLQVRIIDTAVAPYAFVGADGRGVYTYMYDGAFFDSGPPSVHDLIEEVVEPVGPAFVEPVFPPRQADGSINPKDAAALTRVPLHLVPPVANVYFAMACKDGADKYGPYNWRERSISLTQYCGAMLRHIESLLDGEDCATDSELPHLAHIGATAAILLDAKEAGALLDDRPKRPGNCAGVIARMNATLKAKADKK